MPHLPFVHEEIRYGTPAIGAISVAGTTVFDDGPAHAQDLAEFRAWLRERHPAARIVVRCRWRPENYGHVKVTLTPAAPLAPQAGVGPVAEQKRLLFIEQSLIEEVWRQAVGWSQ